MMLEQHQTWRPSRRVFAEALRLVSRHAKAIAWLWFWQLALLIVLAYVALTVSVSPFASYLVGVLSALTFVYQVFFSVCLVFLASDRMPRRLRDVARMSAMPKLPAAVALSLLIAVGTVIGVIAGVIPGVVLYLFWAMAIFVLLVEDTSVKVALQRSVGLVRGWWWLVLRRYLFLFSILTLQTIVGLVPVTGAFVSGLLSLFIVPASVFYLYLTYTELRDIKQFKHLQAAHLSIWAKLILCIWALLLFALFAFFSVAEQTVNDIVFNSPSFLPQNSDTGLVPNDISNAGASLFGPANQ